MSATYEGTPSLSLSRDRQLVFIGGVHRSGTSLLHDILRSHPAVSGFRDTGVPEDEGQFLQNVYEPAKTFGGPGRFGFDPSAFMDETHPLATAISAELLLAQWGRHWDLEKPYLVEKSPPNIVRTRFLQKLFPGSKFVIILRHPIAVSYATRKWSKTSISSLVDHTLRCYERFMLDLPYLQSVYVLRYEDLLTAPRDAVCNLLNWIGLDPVDYRHTIRQDINGKYFSLWRSESTSLRTMIKGRLFLMASRFEARANALGYSVESPEELKPITFLAPPQEFAATGS